MVDDVVRALGFLCLGSRMKRIGERLQADTQRIIESLDMSPVQAAQYPFLAAIDRLGPIGISEMAEAIGITQPGATRAVSLLVKQGLVDVEPSPQDQRRKVLKLTDSGRRTVAYGKETLWPAIEGAVKDLCAALDGPLLEQLAAIEDGLAEKSLGARARSRAGERR